MLEVGNWCVYVPGRGAATYGAVATMLTKRSSEDGNTGVFILDVGDNGANKEGFGFLVFDSVLPEKEVLGEVVINSLPVFVLSEEL